MSVSELGTVTGLAVLLLNAGVQWGIQIASRAQNEKDHERIERSVTSCRSDSHAAIEAKRDAQGDRHTLFADDVRTLSEEIRHGFDEMRGAISTISQKIVEHDVEIRQLKEQVVRGHTR